MSTKVVLSEPLTSAIGTFGGTLQDTSAVDLGVTVVKEILNRTGIDPTQIDEVVTGNILGAGQGQNPSRQVALGSGNSAHSHLTEIYLGKNANLEHGFIALGGGQASCLANISVEQNAHSQYSLTTIQHGWSLSRIEPKIIQSDGKGNTILKGLQISNKKQQISINHQRTFERDGEK